MEIAQKKMKANLANNVRFWRLLEQESWVSDSFEDKRLGGPGFYSIQVLPLRHSATDRCFGYLWKNLALIVP